MEKVMTLFIGCDHGGYELKQSVLSFLNSSSTAPFGTLQIKDFGCHSQESVNYPEFADLVCQGLLKNLYEKSGNLPLKETLSVNDALSFDSLGLLICGTGQGMALKANKYKDIRAALVWNEEISKLAREHNNANILCLPGRFMTSETAISCLIHFLTTPFSQGRHSERVKKINQ
jgi:ribose 5-phosphate isomerase B